MLRQRALSAAILAVPAFIAIAVGGRLFALFILIVVGIGALELVQLVAWRGHRASGGLMSLWVTLCVVDRVFPWLELLNPGVALLLILTLAWAVIRFRQGTTNAVTGFAFTIAGGLYLGWAGAHFVSLRALDEGLFWTLTVCFAVWISDTAAYFVGKAIGHNRLIPDVSPGKTWEGYFGGIISASLITAVLPLLWQQLGASSAVSPLHGFFIGLLVSVVSPLGDIGISMFKRYAGVKNSGHLIPGHGGFLDRVDALIIAGLLGYYYLTFFVL